MRKEIQGLIITCIYKRDGCDWEGALVELDSHLTSCKFVREDKKQCPLVPLGCLTKTFMDSKELRNHAVKDEYIHMVLLVEWIQSVQRTADNVHSGNGRRVLTDIDRDEEDLGYVTMKTTTRYNRLTLLHDCVEKDGLLSTNVEIAQSSVPSLPEKEMVMLASGAIENCKAEILKSMAEGLQLKDSEISALRTQITKLEKQIRSKSAEMEDRDFRLSLIENSNHDGSMIWKIPQFSQRRADAQNGKYTSIFSLPFYSGRYGYKMCLRLYIMGDGIGKGTHLSLFFVVMRGEFDNILQWPFTHKVTFKLINQAGGRDIVDTFQPDPMSSSFRKPKSDMNIASGCPRFVSHTELERGGFIVDDTVFIKCMSDTSTIRHP